MEKVDSQTIRSTPISHADMIDQRKREHNLKVLHDMGFQDEDLNKTLLEEYDEDLGKVVDGLARLSV